MRIRDPGIFLTLDPGILFTLDPVSGMGKIRMRDPGYTSRIRNTE